MPAEPCPARGLRPIPRMLRSLLSAQQIKCDQYWPNRGTETYGFIQVTLLDTIELATFCVRTFSLHKVRAGEGCLGVLCGHAKALGQYRGDMPLGLWAEESRSESGAHLRPLEATTVEGGICRT